jgi:hypothetical protein
MYVKLVPCACVCSYTSARLQITVPCGRRCLLVFKLASLKCYLFTLYLLLHALVGNANQHADKFIRGECDQHVKCWTSALALTSASDSNHYQCDHTHCGITLNSVIYTCSSWVDRRNSIMLLRPDCQA